MTQPGTRVGQGYIDVEPRLNRTQLNRQLRSLTTGNKPVFALDGKFNRTQLNKALREIAPRPTITVDTKFTRTQINKALREINPRATITVDAKFNRTQVQRELRMMPRPTVVADVAFDRGVISRRVNVIFDDVDHHAQRRGHHIGSILGHHLLNAFGGVMSLLPSRLENIFTRTGPLMGSVFAASFAAGLALGLPALGATISGALFTAIGTGAVASGIALAATDPRVKAAAGRLKEAVWGPLKQSANVFVGPVVKALGMATKAMQGWQPLISRMFAASAKFVVPLSRGLIGLVDGFMKPMTRLIESNFMKDLMDITSLGFGKIGEAVGRFFDRFLKDPKAMKGATLALEDMFDLMAGIIGFTGDILQKLSGMWASLNGSDGKKGRGHIAEMRDLWKDIRDLLGDIADEFAPIVQGKDPNKKSAFEGLAEDGKEFLQILRQTFGIMANPNDPGLREWWRKQWEDIKLEGRTAWATLKEDTAKGLRGIRTTFVEEGAIWRREWNRTIAALNTSWVIFWLGAQTVARLGFATLNTIFIVGRDTLARSWKFGTGMLQTIWAAMWPVIQRTTRTGLTIASGIITGILSGMRVNITGVLNDIAKRWSKIWNGMTGTISTVFNNVLHNVKVGLQAVIDVINAGINGINNNVLAKLGLPKNMRVPTIPDIISKKRRGGGGSFAEGGKLVGPGTGTSDSMPIWASNGEFVVNAKSTQQWLPFLQAINNRFAQGGLIGGMFNWLKTKIPGARITSGIRPGDPGYHGSGQAIDLVFSDGSERTGGGLARMAFNLIKAAFKPSIRELIWDFAGGSAVWNGKDHFFTGPGAGPGTHNDHIHWAMGAGANLAAGAFGLLGNGAKWVMEKMLKPALAGISGKMPDNALGWLGRGMVNTLGKALPMKIKSWIDSFMQSTATFGITGDFKAGGGARQWMTTAAQALKMLNLPGSWLGPLLTLIGRESGGNPNAVNNWDSNAAKGTPSKGLMQTIGPTFNAYKMPGYNNIFGPLDNILAGLRYIRATYGSIFNVQQAVGATPRGYDYGGYVPPGTNVIRNDTGRPELLLSHAQEDAMVGGRGPVYVTVKIGDEIIIDKVRAEVDSNNNALVQEFRKGR